MSKVKVHSTPTCPRCHPVKGSLNQKRAESEGIDVSADQEAAGDAWR
jgi:glutaredoxin